MDKDKLHELLRKYKEGSCTPEELKLIDEWYDRVSFPWAHTPDARRKKEVKERSWAKLQMHIGKQTYGEISTQGRERRMTWRVIGIAASITLIVTVAFLYWKNVSPDFSGQNDPAGKVAGLRHIVNDNAEPMKVTLPEGTQITLLPKSNLSFSAAFTARERKVFLEGEAFFEVTHDAHRPFMVITSELTTKVLGTSFLVRAYKALKETVVAVKTGKVSVYTHPGGDDSKAPEPIILTPNQQAVYNSDEQITRKELVKEPQVILPKPTLRYNHTNAKVTDIIKSLEQNYGIDIQYDSAALSNCTITSDMSGAGFMQQIEIICNALGADYKLSETIVTIEGGAGCKTN
jgi:ferric-dicitrate binding protein FerR (iron transport regulator)